ncbi:hypothetical protein B0I37DRAFT_431393 [Chaetomium sp. MPI-CAGE-AT-0009]|nr:hypothetical protein B0I37DRAFT_431393 [Chaetomium sp. MPI-CAGE-AT-0009]
MSAMSDPGPPKPGTPSRVHIRPTAPVLVVEDSEKRVLRERLETIEARDLDRLEDDLKNLSGLFNRRLQTIVTEKSPGTADAQLPSMNRSDPFLGKLVTQNNTRNTNPLATSIRPTNAVATPLRPAQHYQQPPHPVLFTLAAPSAAAPPAPYFHPGPPIPHQTAMGPSAFPPAAPAPAAPQPAASPPRQPPQNPGGWAPQPSVRLRGLVERQNSLPIEKSFLGPPRGGAPPGSAQGHGNAGGAQHNHPPNQNGPPGYQPMVPRRQPNGRRPPLPVAQLPHATSRPPLPVAQHPQAGFRPPLPFPPRQPGGGQRFLAPGAAPYPFPPAFQPGAAFHPTATGAAAGSLVVGGQRAGGPNVGGPVANPGVGGANLGGRAFAPPAFNPAGPMPRYAPTYPPSYVPQHHAPAPAAAPLVLGPLPGRPAILVWYNAVPGQKGPAWVALPRNWRRRFVPRPVGNSAKAMRERGTGLSTRSEQ